MYHPGSNHRITEELQQKRRDDIDTYWDQWVGRIGAQLTGTTVLSVERGDGRDGGVAVIITYSKSMTHEQGRIVVEGVSNDEKEW